MKNFTMEKTMPLDLIVFDELLNQITPIRYEICFSIRTDAENGSTEEILEAHLNQNISFAKVLSFLDGILEHSICVTPYHPNFKFIKEQGYSNNILMLPDVNESTILNCLHSKISNIIHDNTYVESLSLTDLINNISYNYINVVDEEDTVITYNDLPTTEEWLPEFSHWDEPWWFRDDVLTMDDNEDSAEGLAEWKILAEQNNFQSQYRELFQDIESSVRDAIKKIDASKGNTDTGELVEVDFKKKTRKPSWTPTVV